MSKATRILTIGFYFGKLTMRLLWVFPYLRWRMWRAKHFFKRELKKAGLPEVLVKNLVDNYDRQNKNVFSLMSHASSIIRESAIDTSIENRERISARLTTELGE